MKRNIFSLLAAGAMVAGMLTSCSKEDTAALIGNNNYPADGMVRISTTLGDAQPLSRAEGEGTTATYTGINLSLSVDYGAADKYTRANILWKNTSSAWAQDLTADVDPMLWKNAETAAKIYAFAPHVVSATDLTAVPFSVKADQSADGAILASDLVGYKDEAFVPGSSLSKLNELNLAFTHRLSKLTVNLTYGNQYPEGARPTIKNLEVINTNLSATYNAQTLTATALATTTTCDITAATVKTDSYEAIVVPQKIAASTKLVRVTLSDGTKLAYTTPATQLFDANKHYTLSLRIGKDKLEVGSVTVAGWADGTPIPGGEAEPKVVDLTSVEGDTYTVEDNASIIIDGKGQSLNKKLVIGAGATVVLKDVILEPIPAYNDEINTVTCNNNATIQLSGTSVIKGARGKNAGLPGGYAILINGGTLTIDGPGTLTAIGTGYEGAGIGAINGANIVINGGIITASSSNLVIPSDGAPGIGSGDGAGIYENRYCGNITINGGNITAQGGGSSAGIGAGLFGKCGDIVITGESTVVKAAKGASYFPIDDIGKGQDGKCGSVTYRGGATVNGTTYK